MWLYTVSDKPEWWQFEDAADTFEHLYVSRDDVRRNGVLGRVPARKPADGDERPDLEFYAWSRAEFIAIAPSDAFLSVTGMLSASCMALICMPSATATRKPVAPSAPCS